MIKQLDLIKTADVFVGKVLFCSILKKMFKTLSKLCLIVYLIDYN